MMHVLRKIWRLARRCRAQGMVEYALIFALVVLVILLARMGRMAERATEALNEVSTEMAADRQ